MWTHKTERERAPFVWSHSSLQAFQLCAPCLLTGRQSEPADVGCLFVDLELTCETREIYWICCLHLPNTFFCATNDSTLQPLVFLCEPSHCTRGFLHGNMCIWLLPSWKLCLWTPKTIGSFFLQGLFRVASEESLSFLSLYIYIYIQSLELPKLQMDFISATYTSKISHSNSAFQATSICLAGSDVMFFPSESSVGVGVYSIFVVSFSLCITCSIP